MMSLQDNMYSPDDCVPETLRSKSDILSKRESMEAIMNLQENDVAFVKRTNGKYTYARVVGIICITNKYGKEEEALEFKVNAEGSTKTFPKWMWSKFIRCCAAVDIERSTPQENKEDSDNINATNNRNNSSIDNVQKQTRRNHQQQQQQQQQYLDNEISPTSVKTDVGPLLLSKVGQQQQQQQQQQQERQRRKKICSRLDSMNSADTEASSLEGQVYLA